MFLARQIEGRTINMTNFRPKKRFGQHFLDETWAKKVVERINPLSTDCFIEIGPGNGVLTRLLLKHSENITAIELDRNLAATLKESLPDTVRVITGDVLGVDLSEITRQLKVKHCARLRLVGNLPYNVATPILSTTLKIAEKLDIWDATYMLQLEVARRVTATVGTKDYGPLALLTLLYAEAKEILRVPPGAFRPAPKVKSELISLRFKRNNKQPADPVLFDKLTRNIFNQRRKYITNAMADIARHHDVDPHWLCERTQIKPTRRPAELNLSEIIRLSNLLLASST